MTRSQLGFPSLNNRETPLGCERRFRRLGLLRRIFLTLFDEGLGLFDRELCDKLRSCKIDVEPRHLDCVCVFRCLLNLFEHYLCPGKRFFARVSLGAGRRLRAGPDRLPTGAASPA